MVLALPCTLNPSARSRSPTVSALTRCPWRVSSAARWRVDFVVHRNGDIGSPRISGSASASSADRSPGPVTASRLRPPPGLLARPSGPSPDSSSAAPRDTVPSASRRPGNDPDAATTQRPGLRPGHQPPLPLVQMREQQPELRRQPLLRTYRNGHAQQRRSEPEVTLYFAAGAKLAV